MAIIPSDTVYFEGHGCRAVFFEGHDLDEAWMQVGDSLECVWRKDSDPALFNPGDFAFLSASSTSQGQVYTLHQYNAKDNAIVATDTWRDSGYADWHIWNDPYKKTLLFSRGEYYNNRGTLFYSRDGRNFTEIDSSVGWSNSPFRVANGFMTPSVGSSGGTSSKNWRYVEVDDDYNVIQKTNITVENPSKTGYACDFSVSRNKSWGGVIYCKATDNETIGIDHVIKNTWWAVSPSGGLTNVYQEESTGNAQKPGGINISTQVIDIAYGGGKTAALIHKLTLTYLRSYSTTQGIVYVYTYQEEYLISNNWGTPVPVLTIVGTTDAGSVANPQGAIIYDQEKNRFVAYYRASIPGERSGSHLATEWYVSSGIGHGVKLPEKMEFANTKACVRFKSNATPTAGYTAYDFAPNFNTTANIYWYKSASNTYVARSRLVLPLYVYGAARVGIYSTDMILSTATSFYY